MARPEKQAIVSDLKAKFQRAKGIVLADYRGLNVKKTTELRRKLREAGVEYKVVKNTLAQRAARDANFDIDRLLTGPSAMAFGYEDPVAPAKVIVEFARDNKELEIKGGILEGQPVGAESIKALASLPPREVLLARVASGMQAPISGMVQVLVGPLRKLVYVLNAVRTQKEAAAS